MAVQYALYPPYVPILKWQSYKQKALQHVYLERHACRFAFAWAVSRLSLASWRAGELATRLVPTRSVGLATSIVVGGVAAASVLGVPLGAWNSRHRI